MALKTTIEFKGDDDRQLQVLTEGLHGALGQITDIYVRAKEGLNPEVKRVVIEDATEEDLR